MKSILKAVLLATVSLLLCNSSASAQAKKPTIMVVPGDTWCYANGYMIETENQGRTVRTPDYERAMQESMDMVNAITKVNELMSERGFPLKDLSSTIKSINQNAVEDEMTTSRTSGATLAESPLDRLYNRAKADIIVELTWNINRTGPKQSVTYNLKGVDAYSNKQIAASEGTGQPSFSAEVPVLIEEAVLQHMDNFTAQLQAHFDDMAENGREIILTVRVFDNGALSLEDEYGGEELTDVIEAWVNQNTVKHRFNLSDATENALHFEQVRIPLYRENGSAMDARAFSNQLRKYLQKAPYNITCKILTKGLGRADVVLGEK
jgi:hypothetical protein